MSRSSDRVLDFGIDPIATESEFRHWIEVLGRPVQVRWAGIEIPGTCGHEHYDLREAVECLDKHRGLAYAAVCLVLDVSGD